MKICILMAALAAASQAQSQAQGLLPGGIPNPPSSSTAAPAPAAEIKPDTVVAIVAGQSITVADVVKMMKYAPPNLQQIFQQNPQQAIGTAYQMKYLTDQAVKEHLDQQDSTKEALEAYLEWQKEIILGSAMLNQINNSYQVTEDQINEFYKSHQSRYEAAKIKIVMIGFKPPSLCIPKEGQSTEEKLAEAAKCALAATNSPYTRTQEEARTLAEDLVKQLRAGADFGKMVEKYSDDKESKASGGDFGPAIKPTSPYAQEIKKVVFGMKKGEISDPVQEGYSYYVIRLEDLTLQPLGEVLSQIVTEIRNTHQDDYMKDLTKRFTPQVVRPDFFIQAQKGAAGQAQGAQAPPK
jgi:peptidyl-prolyl cis-trans isomerase C